MTTTTSESLKTILALDDDTLFLTALKMAFEPEFLVRTVSTIPEAMMALNQQQPDVMLLDMNMPEVTGLQVLKVVKQRFPDLPIVMLTGETKTDLIVQAIQAGANDYILKGSEDFILSLKLRLSCIGTLSGIRNQNKVLLSKIKEANSKYEILGISPESIKQRAEISKFKGTNAFVLILGENGTGKELVARNLNLQEGKPTRPFIAVNCGAIPANLFESELFGHVKGSFTGAVSDQIGKFTAANGGDIFLDEVGEMPLELQVKLLRVLQEKVITPVGSTKPIPINVRVIAATNRKLEDLVREGKFRQDLFFRLNQITLRTPSLRERPEDILYLAQIFAERHYPGVVFAKETKELLENHRWSGNIRELANTIERACLLLRGSESCKILPEHLMLTDLNLDSNISLPANLFPRSPEEVNKKTYQRCLDWFQRNYFEKALELLGDDNQELMQRLDISRSTYYLRKKELNLSKEQGWEML